MDLNKLPDQLTLRPSPWKWLAVSLIGIVFAASGIWMIVSDGGAVPWFCTLFFGLVAATGAAQLFGGSYLRLDSSGFEQNMLGRKMTCRWDEVSNFGVWAVNGNRFVSFNRVQDQSKSIAQINQVISGGTSSLGDSFGMRAEALAELMNAFRTSHISPATPANEVLIRYLSTYCDVNGLSADWPNDLKRALENPKAKNLAPIFKAELLSAINSNSLSLYDFNLATVEDLDFEQDMNQWLVDLWLALYDEAPPQPINQS